MSDVATKRCAYCAEEIRAEAVKCRYCGSSVAGRALSRTWYRSRTQRRIAGVCGGLADEFGISVTVLRLAFVLAALMSWGVGMVVYLALWVVMPYRPASPRLDEPPAPRALPDVAVGPVDDRRAGHSPPDPGASSS
jgi:phage shock protein PspC (stress-responsive transcriptional regulator)